MSFNTWTLPALSSEARDWRGSVWRMVEAQHVASTMKIVDSQEEQNLLEVLLEGSKPALPASGVELDYLLASPFRYSPQRGGSRFRAVTDPGVFYGAESVRTASAELGYWRWKFLRDAVDLIKLEPVAHTAFRTEIRSNAIDLRRPPFSVDAASWTHPTDYAGCQAMARLAREADLGAIIYRSVRDPKPAWSMAILTPSAFAQARPYPARQTWWLAVHQDEVIWRRESDAHGFSMNKWR